MDLKQILRFIITNPTRKIFAIIFAFGLWFFVAIDNSYQYLKEVKIVYTDLPESLIIVDSVPNINVTFTGRGGSLLSTWAAPPKARCNLRLSTLGENEIPVKKLLITTSFGDLALSFNKNSIGVVIDKKVSKDIIVTVPVKGSLKEGYSISDIVVIDTVEVTGPQEMLLGLNEIATETLNVKNKTSSFKKKLRVMQSSPLLQFSKKEVQAELTIDTTAEKLFTDIPLKLIFTPTQRVSSEKISLDTLIVTGAKNRIDMLTKSDISVTIRLTKLLPGEYDLPATIILPNHIKPVYSNPKRFKITLY